MYRSIILRGIVLWSGNTNMTLNKPTRLKFKTRMHVAVPSACGVLPHQCSMLPLPNISRYSMHLDHIYYNTSFLCKFFPALPMICPMSHTCHIWALEAAWFGKHIFLISRMYFVLTKKLHYTLTYTIRDNQENSTEKLSFLDGIWNK